MIKDAGFSEFAFKNDITPMQKHFPEHIAAHVAHRIASDVWRSFEKHLYHGAKKIHFKRKGTLSSAANQKAGNAMSLKDGFFIWSGGQCKNKISLSIRVQKPSTAYEQEMLLKEIKYFRIIRKWMKTRYKYYLQITVVGDPPTKDRSVGNGRVGIDIGTQSIAIVSENAVHLWELASQVNTHHSKMIALQRRMDVSRRHTNPDNYNEDGTIKRGVKLRWHQSNHYKKLSGQVKELQRKNADIRKYQHTCLANYVISLGTQVFVEDMDFRALQLRSKHTTKDKNGRFNRKKRFGKSLANKAPSMFLTILSGKLKRLAGEELHRVNKWTFKASQYDHLSQKYVKKNLCIRNFKLSSGDLVQRDLYSAFLLMNADPSLMQPNQLLCKQTFSGFLPLHNKELLRIQHSDDKRLSSFGIT